MRALPVVLALSGAACATPAQSPGSAPLSDRFLGTWVLPAAAEDAPHCAGNLSSRPAVRLTARGDRTFRLEICGLLEEGGYRVSGDSLYLDSAEDEGSFRRFWVTVPNRMQLHLAFIECDTRSVWRLSREIPAR